MKKLFFTSDTKHYHKIDGKKVPNAINNVNGIVDQIKQYADPNKGILYIAASPDNSESVDDYASLIFNGLRLSDITFSEYFILDNRTRDYVSEYIAKSSAIFLSGGNTYIENEFFNQLHLSKLLQDFNGIIIGQSAGSINMARSVYNSPEKGALSEPIYLEGLGLSDINIEPHFTLDTTEFDELKMYQRNHQLEESKKRPIYALCDGSHILETEKSSVVYGEAFLIKDGTIVQICNDGQSLDISKKINPISD
ncbi:MAG: Type 1 glutamine amidotransferase-like domain-containing protein [Candidatus Saccharibacteria bacterium]|nr:Type 1 glutamine amidotransferase-like domain-containing protein [Candidatus Saccharibacteria bacterium]